MKKLIIKNGILIDAHNDLHQVQRDILIENGRITAIGKNLEADGCEIINAAGLMISAGMIDIHVHNRLRQEGESLDTIDHLGVWRGVTAVIECGSVCVQDIDDFALIDWEEDED